MENIKARYFSSPKIKNVQNDEWIVPNPESFRDGINCATGDAIKRLAGIKNFITTDTKPF